MQTEKVGRFLRRMIDYFTVYKERFVCILFMIELIWYKQTWFIHSKIPTDKLQGNETT